MIKIAFLLPYPELRSVIEEVFSSMKGNDEILYDIILTSTGSLPNYPLSPDYDAYISRGLMYEMMKRKRSNLLNIELKISGYDVLSAVKKAVSRYGKKKILFVGTGSMTFRSEDIADIFPDVELTTYTIVSSERLYERVRDARDMGLCEVVIGGKASMEVAEELSLPAILLESGKESVSRTVDEAVRTVGIYREEKAKSDRLGAVLKNVEEGVITLDRDGICKSMNDYARRYIDEDIIGNRFTSFYPDIDISSVLSGRMDEKSVVSVDKGRILSMKVLSIKDNHGKVNEVLVSFQIAEKLREIEGRIKKKLNKGGFVAKHDFSSIVTKSMRMKNAIKLAERYAESDENILIEGETGTGKELFAQSIHTKSARSSGPFVAVNLAALPPNLLESELFGYADGAFTGARKGGKMGLFEMAHGGTIFLDEIGELPSFLQARLLRVLQEKQIMRLGDDSVKDIDFRVVAATNRNLKEEVRKGTFRSDLLYRISVFNIVIPPLRDRVDDIPLLVSEFLSKTGGKAVMLSEDAEEYIKSLRWEGNVRELENFSKRLSFMSKNQVATLEDCLSVLPSFEENTPDDEAERIPRVLARNGGRRKESAEELGMDTSTLWRKMKKYNIQ